MTKLAIIHTITYFIYNVNFHTIKKKIKIWPTKRQERNLYSATSRHVGLQTK